MRATKTVLIVGGSGFIGTHVALALRDSCKVFCTYYKHPIVIPGVTSLPFNIENRNWIKRIVYTIRPDIVVYLAGKNSKDWADQNLRRAELLHSVGPASIASASEIIQPRFIYVSNAYVFDGVRGNYHEGDTVLPSTILGKLKLSGENIVKSKVLNYIILRSSPIYGRGNGYNLSFIDYLRTKLDRGEKFEASPYETHSFAPIHGLCELLKRIVDSGVRNRMLHYGGLTKMTSFEFCRAFAKHFKYDPNLVVPKGIIQRKAGLPENYVYDYSLNSTQAVESLKIKPFLLQEGFDLIQKNLVPHA